MNNPINNTIDFISKEQPKNPLQLGHTLYEVLEATIVATPSGKTKARYDRISFNSNGASSKKEHIENLVEYENVIDVKSAFDINAGTHSVFVLSKTELIRIGSDKNSPTITKWNLDASKLVEIVDLDPAQSTLLLLAGQDSEGAFVLCFNCEKGVPEDPIRVSPLPEEVSTGLVVLGGLLVRRQLDANLILFTVNDENKLFATDLGDCNQRQFTATGSSVNLGFLSKGGVVSRMSVSMHTQTSNQQIAIAFPSISKDGKLIECQLILLAFVKPDPASDEPDKLANLVTLTPDISFAQYEKSVFRLSSGRLFNNDVEQLVIGYTATYGSNDKQVKGCAALILVELEVTSKPGKPEDVLYTLKELSNYVVANNQSTNPTREDWQSFASIDLHLAAGLFGEVSSNSVSSPETNPPVSGVLGVLLMGAGATAAQALRGEASILTGLVPVNAKTKSFPPMDTNVPGELSPISTVATIDTNANGFWGLPSDVTGLSVTLGKPTLSQAVGKSQILAIIQPPPFEATVSSNNPELTFSQSENAVEDINVSLNKMWMFSNDTGLTIGAKGQTLARNFSNHYGTGFDKISNNSISVGVHVTTSIRGLLVVLSVDYYVWTYPVYRKTLQEKPDGEMLVIFPMSSKPDCQYLTLHDKNYGFVQSFQDGSLLTYLNVNHPGYKSENLVFKPDTFTITTSNAGTNVSLDKTYVISKNIGTSHTIQNSMSDNIHFTCDCFSYLPVSFGLNQTNASNYNENEMQTTTLSNTATMGITINFGAVPDDGFEYKVKPLVYFHDKMGCLIVTYDIDLSGTSWPSHFGFPEVMLISPYPFSKNLILKSFTRSITFEDRGNGDVNINVSIFSNSLDYSKKVVCEFYVASPNFDFNKNEKAERLLTPDEPIGTRELETIAPASYQTVSLDTKLSPNDRVFVKLYLKGKKDSLNPKDCKVYWAIYPLEAFAKYEIDEINI